MTSRLKKILWLGAVSLLVLTAAVLLKSDRGKSLPQESPEEPAFETSDPTAISIGNSVEGRSIDVHSFGTGETHLLFVGGVHGGYEWNSVIVAEKLIAELTAGKMTVPPSVTINIIPNVNPDGVYRVLGMTTGFTETEALAIAPTAEAAGRFNANNVDLNRNFDCKWQATSTWRGQTVSAGEEAFSEPEAKALRDYVLKTKPTSVVLWHSQANAVYASECLDGILPETLTLMQTYARAGNYDQVATFDSYPITGDAEGWLASIGIPAVTVELETRTSSEWERNRAGVNAVLNTYR